MSADQLRAEIMAIGAEGFERGYDAAVEMLTEPLYAVWLARATGIPAERAEAVLAELHGMMRAAQRG